MAPIISNGKYSITSALHEDHALSVNHITVVARDSDLNTWSLKWHPNDGNYTITLDDGTDRVLDLILFNNRVMIHENLGTNNQRWTIHKIGAQYVTSIPNLILTNTYTLLVTPSGMSLFRPGKLVLRKLRLSPSISRACIRGRIKKMDGFSLRSRRLRDNGFHGNLGGQSSNWFCR